MKILAIDTSCDETAAAVTDGIKILSNIIWSQASLHAKFGGVMPSLAQREHEAHIDWVVDKALKTAKLRYQDLDALAVTVGPGLSIALGVGINKAKELSKKYNKKLISVNHIEAHLLSPFANNQKLLSSVKYPLLGLVVSGGNTQIILIKEIGKYEILAETQDDALGEALDKSARMLGFGYPGGAVLEKMAKLGDPKKYKLPIPIVGHEDRKIFTYSGLKTAMGRLVESEKQLTKEKIYNLSASLQNTAFEHILRVTNYILNHSDTKTSNFFLGGGVANNILLKSELRKMLKKHGIVLHVPYSKKLLGDNAAMIGIVAGFKFSRGKFTNPDSIDRLPRYKIDQ